MQAAIFSANDPFMEPKRVRQPLEDYQLFRTFLKENGTKNGVFKFKCVPLQAYSPVNRAKKSKNIYHSTIT